MSSPSIPPPVMRSQYGNEERIKSEVYSMHLRDDSPTPVQKGNATVRKDKKLRPVAIYPPVQPVLYKTFDWYAGNEGTPQFTGRNFEGKDVSSAKPISKVKMPKLVIESLGLRIGTKYVYKLFRDDEKSHGTLKEVGKENTYLTFTKYKQGYFNDECIRLDDIQLIWNATGVDEIYNCFNNIEKTSPKKRELMQAAMSSLKKRQDWKKPMKSGNIPARDEVSGLMPSRITECTTTTVDPQRYNEFEKLSPIKKANVPYLKSPKKCEPPSYI